MLAGRRLGFLFPLFATFFLFALASVSVSSSQSQLHVLFVSLASETTVCRREKERGRDFTSLKKSRSADHHRARLLVVVDFGFCVGGLQESRGRPNYIFFSVSFLPFTSAFPSSAARLFCSERRGGL